MIVGFEQFLMWMVDTPFHKINNHFKSIAFFCAPCEVDFQYISDQAVLRDSMFETFEEILKDEKDIQILNKFKSDMDSYKALKPYKTSMSAKRVFNDISQRNRTLVELAYEKYRWDFKLFGYSTEGYMMPVYPS